MTAERTKILFVGESATLAHVVRPFFLAQSLDPHIFDVHFASDNYYSALFPRTSAIIRHHIRSRSPQEFLDTLTAKGVLFSERLIREYVEEELALLSRIKPDFVVGDLRLSLAVSAPVLQIPYITITNAYWSPFAVRSEFPLPSSALLRVLRFNKSLSSIAAWMLTRALNRIIPQIFREQGKGLDAVRIKYGLKPFPGYLSGFTFGDYTLYADTPTLCPVSLLPCNHRFIGPICWAPEVPLPDWWYRLPVRKQVIYVSLGSSGEADLLHMILQSLSSMDVTLVVATAGRFQDHRLPKNCFVSDYLPGHEIASRANLVITNGGSPSSYQALLAGVPVLGIPSNVDQLLSMTHIHDFGAGIMLRSDLLTRQRLRQAVKDLLGKNEYRLEAGRLQAEFKKFDARVCFREVVDELVEKSKMKQDATQSVVNT